MLRNMFKIIVLLSLAAPFGAFALGLGDINLKSYLNQPLKAEIELLSIDSSELNNLKVKLASPNEFKKLKIEYSAKLANLKLSVVKKANGVHYIQIRSAASIREPYLNLLLEVSWSNGRILREYALLIDPPIFIPNKSRQIATKAEPEKPKKSSSSSNLGFPSGKDAGKDKSGDNPYIDQEEQVAKKEKLQPEQSFTRGDRPRATDKDNAAFAKEEDKYPRGIPLGLDKNDEGINIADLGDDSGNKHRVKSGETMMAIAKRFKRKGSLMQTMMAIKRANPNAFINNNVHLVKANAQLVIPDSETIDALSNADAMQQYQAQTDVWRQGDQSPVTIAKVARKTTGPKKGIFRLEAPSNEKAKGVADSAQNSKSKADSKIASADTTNSDLATVKRNNKLEDWNIRAEKSKKELLSQIKEKKRLLDIKSSAMASMEASAEKRQFTEYCKKNPTEKKCIKVIRKYCEDNKYDKNCFKVTGFKKVELASLDNIGKTPEKPFNELVDSNAGFVAQVTVLSKKWLKYFKENPVMSAIAGGVALLVLIIIFLFIRQHRKARTEFEESILDFEEDSAMQARRQNVAASSVSHATSSISQMQNSTVQPVSNDQSSYLSDFVVSGMDDINSDSKESDPITEADVFFAYGKYEAAEMLIKEAIQNEPNRLDLRYKLLDIYHGSKNTDSFEFEASELNDMVANKDDPMWQRVVEMGRELAPANALFSDGVPATAVPPSNFTADAKTAKTADSADDFDLDFDFDISDQTNAEDFESELAELESSLEHTENVVSFNPAENNPAEFAGSDVGEYEGDSALMTDVDEVGTKLDLAKAYIDMGDPEGARSILDEVLEEGNDKQKGEAQDLMQQMAS